MSKKPKFTVWNKKQGKVTSSKILKTQKKIQKTGEAETESLDPMKKFVKNFDEQIKNAARNS